MEDLMSLSDDQGTPGRTKSSEVVPFQPADTSPPLDVPRLCRIPYAIIPDEALTAGHSPQTVAEDFNRVRSGKAFLLRDGRALAVRLSLLPLPEWDRQAHTSPEWVERSETNRALVKYLEWGACSTHLSLPHEPHWLSFYLPDAEAENPASRIHRDNTTPGPAVLRIYSVRKKNEAYVTRLYDMFNRWLAECDETQFQSERLTSRPQRIDPYLKPEGEMAFGETGIAITFGDFPMITWPWVDLFLWYRFNLKQADRIRFRFEGAVPPEPMRADTEVPFPS